MAFELVGLFVLLGVAFVPSLYFMVRIRNLERYNRNPWTLMFYAFGWGAVASIVIAIILELWLPAKLESFRPTGISQNLFLAVVIAPLCEESAKILGIIPLSRSRLWEEDDGLVFGATAGLGFAATENLIYELNALQMGFLLWVLVAVLRIATSTLLHASATAMSGWGLSKWKTKQGVEGLLTFVVFLGLAMVMHGTFNLLASIGILYSSEAGSWLLSILLVFVFALTVYRFTRRKIQELDRRVVLGRPA